MLKIDLVTDKATPIDLSRLFCFFAYSYSQMYNPPELGQDWIYFALKATIQHSKTYPALADSALDFISNVFHGYFSEQFVLQYMQECTLASS